MPSNIRELLHSETDRVEWKSSDRDVLPAVCALANDLGRTNRPGYLLVGVDKRGKVLGIDVSDEAQQRLANRLRSTQILPHPSVSIEVAEHEGARLLVLEVQPYAVPPIVRVEQVAWVRVGTTTHRASEADLVRLRERRPASTLPFDLHPRRDASLADLDVTSLRQEYAVSLELDHDVETFPSFESWLAQRDVLEQVDAGFVPTVAGLLVYGFSPHVFLPGATIEFARYMGNDIADPVVQRKTITGSLPTQLEALWAQLEIFRFESPDTAEGIRSPYRPNYPEQALRELARNLVQHRLYEDTHAPARVYWFDERIEFSNPGSRFGRASEGEFGAHSDYRNPTVTRFLVELGYVERLGRGVRMVRTALEKNGNPPIDVETDGFTNVIVRNTA